MVVRCAPPPYRVLYTLLMEVSTGVFFVVILNDQQLLRVSKKLFQACRPVGARPDVGFLFFSAARPPCATAGGGGGVC